MRRKWIKLYCDQWLRGSLRRESIEIRAIFADLLAMAGDTAYGEQEFKKSDGVIQVANGYGFTDEVLASLLNIPLKTWLAAKERLANHPEVNENRIEIVPLSQGFGLRILNWQKYQAEYSRQKPYREAKKEEKPSLPQSPSQGREEEEERRKNKEGEGEEEEKVTKVITKVTKLLNLLKEFPPYPFNEEEDKEMLEHFINKYPCVDFQRQVERKIKFWQENPETLNSKKRARMQLYDFFEGEISNQKRRGI